MRFAILVLLFAAAYASPTENPEEPTSEEPTTEEPATTEKPKIFLSTMKVPLDHFNLFDNRTWEMRYMFNNEFYKPGHPLFLDVGGEWEITGQELIDGQMYKLAKEHNGMLISTEHRYYGQSLPFGTNFTTENLKYLQIEQALEDLAYFIDHVKELVPSLKKSKVILHGCSYPGMLVTWMRLRFPHVVDISYASSAPLGVGLDYPEFFQVVHDAYANVSPDCADTIKQGFNLTQQLVKSKIGLKTVKDALRGWGCGDVDQMNSNQIISKMVGVLNVMHDPVQYQELGCLILSLDELSAFHKLADFIVLKSLDAASCADQEDPTGVNERNSMAWEYQTCTEMGTFQTLDIKDPRNPFAMDASVEESVDECNKKFENIVTKDILENGIERVTRRYGGKRPLVTKVISVQGKNDPWKHLSVLEDYNSEAPVLLINGSHCTDVSERDDDPEELLEVRKKIRDTISKWIKEIS